MRTRRAPRVALTAGGDRDGRAWARSPHTEHESEPAMPTDHTLTAADVAARCAILDADVATTPDGTRYKVTPPADATTPGGARPAPVYFPVAEFRSNADRTLTVRNLRLNGLDVTADRDWSGRPAAEPDPVVEVPKLELPGPRPTLTYAKQAGVDGRSEDEVEDSEALINQLGVETARVVENATAELRETVAKLASRVDALEARPTSAVPPSQRLGRLDESVGSLARRVAGVEDSAQQVAEHGERLARLEVGHKVVVGLVNDHHPRLAALESAAPAAAGPSRIDTLGEAAITAMAALPPRVSVTRSTIGDMIGAERSDLDSLSKALERLHEAGKLTKTGTRGSTRWAAIREDES